MKSRIHERVYGILREAILTNGLPLTAEEIASQHRLKPATVEKALHRLERQGRITRLPQRPRSIRLPEIDRQWALEETLVESLARFIQDQRRLPQIHELADSLGYAPELVQAILPQLKTIPTLPVAA